MSLQTRLSDLAATLEDSAVFFAVAALASAYLFWRIADWARGGGGGGYKASKAQPATPEKLDPPRNFTLAQLAQFRGETEGTPIYLSIRGEVFDVSDNRPMYGPEGSYHLFAGHEVSKSLARMSFEPEDLDVMQWDDLSFGEKDTLDGWVDSFRHGKGYAVVGRVVPPPEPRPVTPAELAAGTGSQPAPPGAAAAPILVAVDGKVFDMSYGGVVHYGPQGPYRSFAGRDATRALAKMSLDPADLDAPSCADLSADERSVLRDWLARFEKKGYPVIGNYVAPASS
ncbi:unnamed protein product [Phaeothamnion confervicola]